MTLPQLDSLHASLHAAISQLGDQLEVLPSVPVDIADVGGRILAEPLLADRDSPALDVSAMDGYALKLRDLNIGSGDVASSLYVQATTPAGSPPVQLNDGMAVRIFTGAPVPPQADCVVRREDTHESESQVSIRVPATSLQPGQNIRRRGENTRRGEVVLPAGTVVDSAAIAAIAAFGGPRIAARQRVRVAILNTGDELAQPGEEVHAWQIRDSNGLTLQTWLDALPWVEVVRRQRVADTFANVREALTQQATQCDAIILTGGVSMGDTDFVPSAVEAIGGEIAFHRLPLRPGKPVLGAALNGKLVLGLPGNPVSVAVTARVFGLPLLAKIAGARLDCRRPLVNLAAADDKRLDLVWFRLVEIDETGEVRLVTSQGSGDLVSLARSSGFVEIPPGQAGNGPWPFTMW